MNPEIDIGQVEGAFVMGLGYWMTEKVMYDSKTGEELTYSTWVSIAILRPMVFASDCAQHGKEVVYIHLC